jgi:D-beta-D-heptose 7-phosphate kinase/D-beta-D-heptose 1-phosphate adenosyltransferase
MGACLKVSAPTLPVLERTRADEIVQRMATSRVVVVGDVMLDQFIFGHVGRISPEAPVPVVTYDHEQHRAGGAANVALNARSLGARVELLGVVGQDDAAEKLRDLLHVAELGPRGLVTDLERRTTTKVRIVTTRNQQVARIDYESDAEVGRAVEDALADLVDSRLDGAGAIVVSDYLKGVVTRRLMAHIVAAGQQRGVPVLVDPKIPHLEYYAGASLVTPNHHEAETATHLRIRSDEEARAAAKVFRERAKCEGVLITRGEHGMWLAHETAEGQLPTAAREVSDVTGAGDTVVATLALAMAAGATWAEAARLANEAAGIVVGKFGPAAVTPSELVAQF